MMASHAKPEAAISLLDAAEKGNLNLPLQFSPKTMHSLPEMTGILSNWVHRNFSEGIFHHLNRPHLQVHPSRHVSKTHAARIDNYEGDKHDLVSFEQCFFKAFLM